MCDFSAPIQKISSLLENLDKAVNDKVQNRSVDLLHKNIKALQSELAQKNAIIKSFMEIQMTVEEVNILYQHEEMTKLSQINNNNNNNNKNNLSNYWNTINKQCVNASNTYTSIKYN